MRPIINLGSDLIPSYTQYNTQIISTSNRIQRQNSSLTRQRRSNSKNQKFDMTVSSITNINTSINGLLNIVRKEKHHDLQDRFEIERALNQSKEKYTPKIYERGNYQNKYSGTSPYREKVSSHEKQSQFTIRTQKASHYGNATIKYSQPKEIRNGSIRNQSSLLKCSKQTHNSQNQVVKNEDKEKKQENGEFEQENKHEISDWWNGLLEEVDGLGKNNNDELKLMQDGSRRISQFQQHILPQKYRYF